MQQPRVVKVIVRKNKKIAMIEFDFKNGVNNQHGAYV